MLCSYVMELYVGEQSDVVGCLRGLKKNLSCHLQLGQVLEQLQHDKFRLNGMG